MWFGLTKSFTSLVRWLIQLLTGLFVSGWICISPPFLKKQLIWSTTNSKLIRLRIESYYDWATLSEVFTRREYDTRTFRVHNEIRSSFSEALIKGAPLILDLGANIGIASNFFFQSYVGARIVAVEPSASNVRLLQRNTKGLAGVEHLHAAVGPNSGSVSLYDPRVGNNAFRTFGDENEIVETVDCVTVQDLIEKHKDCIPFLVKIDIEGFEKQLFSSNTDWVDLFKVLVVETHDWMLPGQAVSSNLLRTLGGKNRDLIFLGENLFSIRVD
jgi:FkbM family methyltransferase